MVISSFEVKHILYSGGVKIQNNETYDDPNKTESYYDTKVRMLSLAILFVNCPQYYIIDLLGKLHIMNISQYYV